MSTQKVYVTRRWLRYGILEFNLLDGEVIEDSFIIIDGGRSRVYGPGDWFLDYVDAVRDVRRRAVRKRSSLYETIGELDLLLSRIELELREVDQKR